MFGHYRTPFALLAGMFSVALAPAVTQAAIGTGFTYQGQLRDSGVAVEGSADFNFLLFSAASGGTQQGSTISRTNVSVTDGIFTVELDFGVSPFTANADRFLEIQARTPAGVGGFITLTPRQRLSPTPFSLNTRGLTVDSVGNVTVPTGALTINGATMANGGLFADDISTNAVFALIEDDGRAAGEFEAQGVSSIGGNFIASGADAVAGSFSATGDATQAISAVGDVEVLGGLNVIAGKEQEISLTAELLTMKAATNEDVVWRYSESTDSHTFSTGGNQRLTIDALGDVEVSDDFEAAGTIEAAAATFTTEGLISTNTDSGGVAGDFRSTGAGGIAGSFTATGQATQAISTTGNVDIFGDLNVSNGNGLICITDGNGSVASTFGASEINGIGGFFTGAESIVGIGSATVIGNLDVSDTLSKGAGSFKIDHPLDPENKYLYHSFVESPDMMNIYNGNVITDGQGLARITMPNWFDAVNRDFRYQLTVMGQFAQAIVHEKLKDNRFTIKTDKPNVEVSWQITGIRKDAFAEAHRIQVEVDKPEEYRGSYLHPDCFGQPAEKGQGHRIREKHQPDKPHPKPVHSPSGESDDPSAEADVVVE